MTNIINTIRTNKKGFSLIVTLILSFVALGFISALLYLIMSGTTLSGKGKIYTSALEAAKGLTDVIVLKINTDSLTCNPSPCSSGSVVTNVANLLDGTGYTGTIRVINKSTYAYGTPSKNYDLYLINIVVTANFGKDRSEVEFAYEVEK
ncbi:MAG: hypothetical protein N3C60_01035 [Calditerrivibrio sp.]|nr:hypothetical protein [Calditerrivibrio sp.]